MEQLLNHARRFNSKVIFLTKAYVSKKDSDRKTTPSEKEQAYRAQKRISLVCKEDDFYIIKGLGPSLIKYGSLIEGKKWDEFARMNYEDEINAASDKEKTVHYIGFFKEIYASCSEAEKKILENTISDMLSIYCEYALCAKQLS